MRDGTGEMTDQGADPATSCRSTFPDDGPRHARHGRAAPAPRTRLLQRCVSPNCPVLASAAHFDTGGCAQGTRSAPVARWRIPVPDGRRFVALLCMTGGATAPARALQQRRKPQVRPTVAFGGRCHGRVPPGRDSASPGNARKVACSGACRAPGRRRDFHVGTVPLERFL